ncbi:MAG: ribbon-helix-helix domain-containing protein [Methanoregula sp.]|nr:ribbon-helix-helix domain-containing protein [Methanoregula sp.]
MTSDRVTIKIPKPLFDNLQQLIEGTGFSSVTEFIVYVMRSLASKESKNEPDNLTSEEIQSIKERLRKLGYF